MDAGGRYVLVPLSVASLATGLLQSLATPWGPFRHNWVVAKLTINVFASLVLLLYLQTLAALADVARRTAVDGAGLDQLRSPSPTIHADGCDRPARIGRRLLGLQAPRFGEARPAEAT